MPDRDPRESQDLSDYETDDAYNTLDGDPGDDPLDRGVAPPQRWSRAIRNSDEEPSLDEQLAEEEPDTTWDEYEDDDEQENEAEEEDDAEPAPRAGRLVGFDGGHHPRRQSELLAHDVGADGGAASAEEAAEHVVEDDE